MQLIPNIDSFKEHVGLNASAEADYYNALLPDLLLAEDEHLRGLLGDFYQVVLDEELTADADRQARLRYLLRSALANLTMVSFLDVAQVQLSGSGVHIISTDREKTAFQWQINALKASHARKGYNGLEKVLAYLEKEATAFPEWAASDTAKATRGHFLSTAADFSQHYNITNARLTFVALQALLRKTETFWLEPVIGGDFFDELKEQLRAGTLTVENRLLVEKYLRPALAHLTMAAAIAELPLSLNGAALELSVYRPDDANNKEADAGITLLLEQKTDLATRDGERFLRRLRTHLNAEASADKYATYFTSSAYEPTEEINYITTKSTDPVFGAM